MFVEGGKGFLKRRLVLLAVQEDSGGRNVQLQNLWAKRPQPEGP